MVDECHRAKGNSDIVMAVKKLREEKCKFRVLGLSATPGSSNEAIQVVHHTSLHGMLTGLAFVTSR